MTSMELAKRSAAMRDKNGVNNERTHEYDGELMTDEPATGRPKGLSNGKESGLMQKFYDAFGSAGSDI